MSLFINPVIRATDANADALSGAKLYFYAAGTTVPKSVYTSATLAAQHPNPVVADSGGLFPAIYLDDSVTYRATLKDAGGTVIQDIDPYDLPPLIVTPEQFGAVGDGVTDDTAAFNSMISYLGATAVNSSTGLRAARTEIVLPAKTYYIGGNLSLKGATARWRGMGANQLGLVSLGVPAGSATVIRIASSSKLYLDRANTLFGTVSSATPFGCDGSVFQGIVFQGAVEQHCNAHFVDCGFLQSSGIGLNIVATSNAVVVGDLATSEGNANTSSYTRCVFAENAGDGVRIGKDATHGTADVNALRFDLCFFSNNGGLGSADYSFLGVTFDSCHWLANSGGPHRTFNANATSWVRGYVETGQGKVILANRAMWAGGFAGDGVTGAGIGATEGLIGVNGLNANMTDGVSTMKLVRGGNLSSRRIDEFNHSGFGGGTIPYVSRFRNDTIAWQLGYADADVTRAVNGTGGYTHGLSAAPHGVHSYRELAIGDGFYPDGRIIRYGSKKPDDTGAPNLGERARGEIVFNLAPSAGGAVGWVCVTSGSPGTWKEFGTIAA